MSKVKVKLTVSRAGPGGAGRGDTIEVGIDEAKRMYDAGQIQAPTSKILEKFAAMDKAAAAVVETAEADKAGVETADKAAADKAAADKAAADKAAADKAAADKAAADKAAADKAAADKGGK